MTQRASSGKMKKETVQVKKKSSATNQRPYFKKVSMMNQKMIDKKDKQKHKEKELIALESSEEEE